jgi:putative spermidine/putrescine transport system ATP-binding protein
LDEAHADRLLPVGNADPMLVEFDSVTKNYGEFAAVRDLTLSINEGEFFTMLGPSGSGKTSSLMMLAGFQEPSSGDIRIAGHSLAGVPPHKRGIGIVFQNYALFPHFNVFQNIAFPLSVRKMNRAQMQDTVRRVLSLVRLEGYENRQIHELSGGQQQRVALARALVFDPKLVLMDEPLGALDKQLREHLQVEIKQIQQRTGVTVLYVTHDQSEALTMSDRIAVFQDGWVRQVGDSRTIYEKPQDLFVARFIGETNSFDGRAVRRNGDSWAVELPSGQTVYGLSRQDLQEGAAVTLCIRPERIVLNPGEGVCDSVLNARVVTSVYYGDHQRFLVKNPSGFECMLKAQAKRGFDPEVGDELKIGWETQDASIFASN